MFTGAVLEAVNECEAGNSPPDTGGVSAPSIKGCEATLIKAARYRACASRPSTPPMSGGEWRAQFIHAKTALAADASLLEQAPNRLLKNSGRSLCRGAL